MITLTEQASSQLKNLMTQQGMAGFGLRVFVTPGGCSGFNYGMQFENTAMEGDAIEDFNGIKLFIDEFSAAYVEGAEIDYEDALMGGGFTVHNPNAISSCSCGQSFQAAQGGGSARACGH